MSIPGPAAFGRGVVVAGAAAVPPPWAGAPEVVVDDEVMARAGAVVGVLHAAWAARRPLAVRLLVEPGTFRAPRSVAVEPWTLPPDFEVVEDRLQFLVWNNNYDARPGGPPVWWWARKAARLGAVPAVEGSGDVLLPGGGRAWIDGGPRTPWEGGAVDGAGVVDWESVERDHLVTAPPARSPGAALAADQRAAVGHGGGPARIIAPAGSGKTRVLTERLRHVVVDRGWERDAVLAVAYNKRAQVELDARTADFSPRTRTLNSLGLSILTRARGRPPELLEERDVRRLLDRLAPVGRRRANTDPIGPYVEALGEVRLGLRHPEEVEASRDDVPGLAALWPAYRAALAERGAVDFDEQVYGAVAALLADGELRQWAQRGCRHLLVDEFQDLTPAHVVLLRLLSTPTLDCFGVGDDDQVIYGHAGADPGFLIDFARLFPFAADHPLQVNYRCPAEVVEAAARLLSHNRRRVPKVILAARPPAAGGAPALSVRRHAAGRGTAELVDVVAGWIDGGAPPASVAVLLRVNALVLAPVVALRDSGVAVASSVRPEVLERTGLRAALAYLRIATAPDDRIAAADLTEVLRRPSRGLPPWFAERLRRRGRWTLTALGALIGAVPGKDAGKVERFVDDIVALRAAAPGRSAAALLRFIRTDIGLGGAMTLLDTGRGGEGSSHLDDLEGLEAVAELHEEADTFEAWLRQHIARPPEPTGVTVSTVHRVKGMEWDRVAVHAVNAGLYPHRLAEDAEEERRVLHVAVTRGRTEVAVLADRSRPSPMLVELTGEGVPPDPDPVTALRAGAEIPAWRRRPGGASTRGPRETAPAPASGPAAAALEEALRAWRRQRAGADGVPAYVVFSDRTLRAIAAARPTSLVALRQVDGIGPTKLELYGDDLLALVASVAPAAAE